MKKLFLAIALASIGLTACKKSKSPDQNTAQTQNVICDYGQCQATAKSTGNQCLRCVSNSGDTYCWQHD